MQVILQERISERIEGHIESTSRSSAVQLDTAEWLGDRGFRTFYRAKKVRRQPRTCCRTRAHGRRRLMSSRQKRRRGCCAYLGRTGGKELAGGSSGEGCRGRGGGEHPQERGAGKEAVQ